MTFVTFLMTHKRPVNINLFKIQLPLSALLSITHRISGILIFFIVLPVTIIALSFMYESQESYDNFINFYSTNLFIKLIFSLTNALEIFGKISITSTKIIFL